LNEKNVNGKKLTEKSAVWRTGKRWRNKSPNGNRNERRRGEKTTIRGGTLVEGIEACPLLMVQVEGKTIVTETGPLTKATNAPLKETDLLGDEICLLHHLNPNHPAPNEDVTRPLVHPHHHQGTADVSTLVLLLGPCHDHLQDLVQGPDPRHQGGIRVRQCEVLRDHAVLLPVVAEADDRLLNLAPGLHRVHLHLVADATLVRRRVPDHLHEARLVVVVVEGVVHSRLLLHRVVSVPRLTCLLLLDLDLSLPRLVSLPGMRGLRLGGPGRGRHRPGRL